MPVNSPVTPGDISILVEQGEFVFRVDDLSIYTYDRDVSGQSHCYDKCAEMWPPVPVSSQAKVVANWTIIERADNSKQWAYKDRPVYFYSGDTVGQMMGDGVGGEWHLVKP